MNSIFYYVNGKKFSNEFLAQYESYKSGSSIKFLCNDDLYDNLNWINEPEESMEFLMNIHALNLRQKYDYIILNWSGGTDSHTIYNVFKRNNIHIDEIVAKYTSTDFFPKKNVEWLQENHWDSSTKITVFHDHDKSKRKTAIYDENWLFDDSSSFKRFGSTGVDLSDIKVAEDNCGHKNWCIIVGFEKPYLVKINSIYYSTIPDNSVRAVIGSNPRIECFFLEPKIHLKQSHLLKKYLKNNPNVDIKDPYGYKDDVFKRYNIISSAIGRHDELFFGVSATQKNINKKRIHNTLITDNVKLIDFNSHDIFLDEKLKDGDQMALNYLKGFYNLKSDSNFWKFLNDNSFKTPNGVLTSKPIFSKFYNVGN